MADPTGEALRLDFDRRLRLEFRGSTITSDAGLLPYRELDDAIGLTDTGADTLADARTGKNGRHRLAGLLRQSVFGRLAGYEDVNDADRLCRDSAMRWVVGGGAIAASAASASERSRFEAKWLSGPENLAALADLSGHSIDQMRRRRPPRIIALDVHGAAGWRAVMAAPARSGSRKERTRPNGGASQAALRRQRRAFPSMRRPTTAAISCGRWRCPGRRSRGR